jgi:EAL domain-containing protein (putative c-di-GMP-specific phosphodiesterase class I)
MELVRMVGCTEVQGYFVGRPQPLKDVSRLLKDYMPRQKKLA